MDSIIESQPIDGNFLKEMLDAKTLDTIRDKHRSVSSQATPGSQVKVRQKFEYVNEAYMRNQLNKHFPAWTWEIKQVELLGDQWVYVIGRLTVIDESVPRYYDAVAGHRIQRNRSTGELVDISNDMKAANSDCFKVAVNRLCNVADDVYRKMAELTEEQEKEISSLLAQVTDSDVVSRVRESLESGDITPEKYNSAMERLKLIIKKQGDE